MDGVCRICSASSTTATLVSIFEDHQSWNGNGQQLEPALVQLLNDCFDCQIKIYDALSQSVCLSCVLAAKNAYRFKQSCRQDQVEVKEEPQVSHEVWLAEDSEEEEQEPDPEPVSIHKRPVAAAVRLNNRSNNTDESDELKLRNLLRSFDLENLFECLQVRGVTYRCLRYISKDDIKEAIPHNIGFRAEFREKLFMWRKKELNSDDDETPSSSSKVQSWLQKNAATARPTPSTPLQTEFCRFQLDIHSILQNCSKGKSLLSYYAKTSKLTNSHREQLISIIVDEANCNDMLIKNTDYPFIIRQIVSIFPTESATKEFYFIPRALGKNPSGKLYAKYRNARSKRKKLNHIPEPHDSSVTDNNSTMETLEPLESKLEGTLARAFKEELKGNGIEWQDIVAKWSKTFTLRRRDLEAYQMNDFLKEWPAYADSRAGELIKLDFNLLHPTKTCSLSTKWEHFKSKILPYYQVNVHNMNSRQLLTELQYAQSVDSSDYILAILLPSVLPPTSWYKAKAGEPKRKVTLLDSQESFVLRLPSIANDGDKINRLILKNLENSGRIQPYIIVEGFSSYNLTAFYVYFDKTLYKLSTFLDCLDLCLKVFNIFNLRYPIASELPWLFIQKYFYEIETCYDARSANLTALLGFLRS